MPFVGEVDVTPINPDGKRWRLLADFEYHGAREVFVVPKDFTTDFASVPRVFVWLLPRYGRWTQAAILHDYLWHIAKLGEIDNYDANGIFNRAMRELGVPFLRRWIMWAAVQWAAHWRRPWRYLERGPLPLLKMLAISIPTLALVGPPAVLVFAALVAGAACEFVAYVPLRLTHRPGRKQVNRPDAREILLS
jgi:hypothetical protein